MAVEVMEVAMEEVTQATEADTTTSDTEVNCF